ncbi:hypothetical protein [Campylobacter showae]|uniref:hypothetical protein n=1 Tax=Campylobacter showae TaxID=204 RepID=UPI001F13EF9E|nr:hypothetical protein [Campylobacter showae]
MDEPTTGLDFGNQIKLLDNDKDAKRRGVYFPYKTTHYPIVTLNLFQTPKYMFLKDGKN